ncbi:MAG: HDOD domain-containing protein [Sideroxydans sp.]|nr:HDOD domain-containing protein [Sideroxydans sp.]
MEQQRKDLQAWVAFLGHVDIPVLKQTARDLAALHQDEDNLSARNVAQVIGRDPMMTVKLLRYLQQHKHKSQTSEVVQAEQALLMLGLNTFFGKIPPQPVAEEGLRGQIEALTSLLRVVRRSQRASQYAVEWAARRNDLHYEEVRIAALLHDLAELLMWCYAPADMLQIRALQQQDKTLRSHAAQEAVLGFSLLELQRALVHEWELPKLLLTLMEDGAEQKVRERNVVLAVNLARHSANGWDDAALPDDYRDIGELLHMSAEQVMAMLGVGEDPSRA